MWQTQPLIYIGNYVFQQTTTCKITKFSTYEAHRLNHSGPSGDTKTSKFLSYNFS